jgi:hypothetical protein
MHNSLTPKRDRSGRFVMDEEFTEMVKLSLQIKDNYFKNLKAEQTQECWEKCNCKKSEK